MTDEMAWCKAGASASNGNCVEVTWRKAEASGGNGGNCVEVGWRKAMASGANNGQCVEVVATVPEEWGSTHKLEEIARDGVVVLMRDSKDPDGPWLNFTKAEWAAFLDGVKKGEFDDLTTSVEAAAVSV
jgi:hypothetical protein